jgi:hypothetical protein
VAHQLVRQLRLAERRVRGRGRPQCEQLNLASASASKDPALRRIALGRKNYLFVHDGDSGASLAGLYSLVATCEARQINPFDYLTDVFARVQDHPSSAIDELLPGAWAAGRDDV